MSSVRNEVLGMSDFEVYKVGEYLVLLSEDEAIVVDNLDSIGESRWVYVVRNGRRKRKLILRPGYKNVDGHAVRMSLEQRRALRKAGRRLGRLSRRYSNMYSTKLRRQRSLAIRNLLGGFGDRTK